MNSSRQVAKNAKGKKLFAPLRLCAILLLFLCSPATAQRLSDPGFLASLPAGAMGAPASELLPFIDATRLTDWRRHETVGVTGGPVFRTSVYTNFTGDTNGVTNERSAIQAAINAASASQVVQLPAGTFNVDGGALAFQFVNKVTLRGTTNAQGYPLTVLKDIYHTMGTWSTNAGVSVTSGAIKGSTNVVVASTTGIEVGKMSILHQITNGYEFIADYSSTPQMSHAVYVTSISGTTVGFRPPLFADFTNQPTLVGCGSTVISNSLEDLVLDRNGNSTTPLAWEQTVDCWVRNVVVTNMSGKVFQMLRTVNCEVRDSIFTAMVGGGPNHEGIHVNQSSGALIENNVFDDAGFPPIMLNERLPDKGVIGCVVAYNVMTNSDSGTDIMAEDISINHAGHTWFSLVEGNVAGMVKSDGYSSGDSHNTIFRNVLHAQNAGADTAVVYGKRAVSLERGSRSNNVVGNILGRSTSDATVFTTTEKCNGGSCQFDWITNILVRLGYPNGGNMALSTNASGVILTNPPSTDITGYDANVTNTLILHGNYDYVSASVKTISTRSNTLPSSLYAASKPGFFNSAQSWPIDPANPSAALTNTPAVYRHRLWKTGALTP